ncbi:flagellar hook-length control protein FliK [Shewanella avicenniae]|uniref:Flagellar hook-length control protein FliK n=1 Tax=Shewanella avicenniae TaxID=2814294 RepID=A0ABX7QN95_9GAMM|nr:flagellar hook-length control protein FliK [Shewanella avicenniae]QSX32719.1 flagellar hook-length control protein FliK [Shewanella avicenniae]
MQQLASQISSSSNNAPKLGAADGLLSTGKSIDFDNLQENPSFNEIYQQAQGSIESPRKSKEFLAPYQPKASTKSQAANAVADADDSDAVTTTLQQIALGKMLPSAAQQQVATADNDTVTNIDTFTNIDPETEVAATELVQQLAGLSPAEQDQLQAMIAKLLAQLSGGDAAEKGDSAQDADRVVANNESAESSAKDDATLLAQLNALVAALMHPQAKPLANEAVDKVGANVNDDAADISLEQLLVNLEQPITVTDASSTADKSESTDEDISAEDGSASSLETAATASALVADDLIATPAESNLASNNVVKDQDEHKIEQLAIAVLSFLAQAAEQNVSEHAAQPSSAVNVEPAVVTNSMADTINKGQQALLQMLSQRLATTSNATNDAPQGPATAVSAAQGDVDSSFVDKVMQLVTNADATNTHAATMSPQMKFTAQIEVDSMAAVKDLQATQMHNLQQQQTQSPASVHLSLRQANEAQVNQQELVQRFAPVMRQQLLTMVKDGIQHAEIRLDPPELGSMTVKVQVRGDHTQVQFHVTQTQAKDLIDQAMPRLRDMLQQQGMNLADSQVSYGGSGQQSQSGMAGGGSSAAVGEFGADSDESSTEVANQALNISESYASGIDYYA